MPKTSLSVRLLRLKIYPLNVTFNYLWMAQILTGVYLQCFTVIVVERIIQKSLTLALAANIFSMAPLSLVSRLQIGFWIRSWKLCGNSDDAPARWDTYTKICEVDEFRLMFWSYIVSNPLSLGSSFNIDTGKDTGIVRNRIVGVCSTTHLHLARRVVKIRHY